MTALESVQASKHGYCGKDVMKEAYLKSHYYEDESEKMNEDNRPFELHHFKRSIEEK